MNEKILTRWKRFGFRDSCMERKLYFNQSLSIVIIYKSIGFRWEIYPNYPSGKIIFEGVEKSLQDAMNEADAKLIELGYRFEEEPNIGLLI